MQTEVAQHQGAGTGVIYESAQGGGNPLGTADALLDFPALGGIAGTLQFEFQVRQDAKQRIVNPGRAAPSASCARVEYFSYSASCA